MIASLLLFFCFSVSSVSALNLKNAFGTNNGTNDDPLDTVADTAGINTQDAENQVNTFVASIIQTFLSLLGVLFLGLMIYGGILWMTARGNQAQVDKARDLITAAIIGLAIVVGAYVITYFVIERVTSPVLESFES